MLMSKNIMKILDVEMEVEDFAEFMFIRNTDNKPLEVYMGGLDNNKDMYYFCLDLFCKGLVMLFSNNGKSVSIEELSQDDFNLVKAKMACAGINVYLEVAQTSPEDLNNGSLTNLKDIDMLGDNMSLENYKFILNTIPYKYIVSFSLFRNI
jgi:hypothetical protein